MCFVVGSKLIPGFRENYGQLKQNLIEINKRREGMKHPKN
jgi:hypothetical protein